VKTVFVIGAPRSGTSYLARSLALANNVAYWEEAGAFSLFGPRAAPFQYSGIMSEEKVFRYSTVGALEGALFDRLRSKDRLEDLLHNMYLHKSLGEHDLKPSGRLIEVQGCVLDSEGRTRVALLHERLKKDLLEGGIKSVFQEIFEQFCAITGHLTILEKRGINLTQVEV